MLYRGRYETDKSLAELFKSLKDNLPKGSFELLVRIDDDDLYGKCTFKQLIHEYPTLNVRYFIHHRWEGRWSINYDYLYLFTHKNKDTKWIGFLTDDCVVTRDVTLDLDEKYHIMGDLKSEVTEEKMSLIENYKDIKWLTPDYICAYPLMSSYLAKIMCNMGYQVNIDSTLALISAILYKKYKIIISKHIPEFILRNNVDRSDDWGNRFNRRLIITDTDMPNDELFFELMEQQVHNIYLNLMEKK